jgi:NADH dehydrogenase
VSITNPLETSTLEYFSGKARLERVLAASGLQYSILRPTVLFGHEDILINNIAWALRRFPVFAVFGDGHYRLQPICVEDLAAVGQAIGHPRRIVHVSPGLGYVASRIIGWFMNDVFITREEIKGLMDDLLYVNAPPAGTTKLTDWMRAHSATLGVHYANELARRTPALQ